MLLALDIGNTNITLGLYKNDDLILLSHLASDSRRLTDQYAADLKGILEIHKLSAADIDDAVICSVVPPLTAAVQRAVKLLTGVTPLLVDISATKGFAVEIDSPETLGADFIAGCVAAKAKYDCPAIIFDLGTATTMAVLDKSGAMTGGAIMAGIGISLDALSGRTAQLPQINTEGKCPLIGKNTIDCMRSGAIYGTAAMIDGLCERVEKELGKNCSVILTGGFSRLIFPLCGCGAVVDEYLLMDGMRAIASNK